MIHLIYPKETYECTNLGQALMILCDHEIEPKMIGDFELVKSCEEYLFFVNSNLHTLEV
jgi:hypothetical protein